MNTWVIADNVINIKMDVDEAKKIIDYKGEHFVDGFNALSEFQDDLTMAIEFIESKQNQPTELEEHHIINHASTR